MSEPKKIEPLLFIPSKELESDRAIVRQFFGMRDDQTMIPRDKYEEFRRWLKQLSDG